MEAVNFREVFKKNCYIPALEMLVDKISKDFGQSVDEVVKKFLDPLDAFLQMMAEHQRKGKISSVKRLCISFLRTSMYLEKPLLLVEAYEDLPFVVRPVMACEIDATWMFSHWTAFQESMRESTRQQSLSRYVRKPEMRSYESQAISAILRYFAACLKYAVRVLERRSIWETLGKLDDFTISFGEYLDWQLPLLELKKEIDIFLCEEKEDLSSRRFQGLYYEDKQFPERDMDDCVFQSCSFRNTVFQGTKLRNVRFIECTFEDCRFDGVELMGSSIISSRLKKVAFQKCKILGGFHRDEQKAFPYPNGKFKWSLLEEIRWLDTDITDAIFVGCQLFDVM